MISMNENKIKCFLIVPSGKSKRYMRRFSKSGIGSDKCPKHGYHDARTYLDLVKDSDDCTTHSVKRAEGDIGNWPKLCACGYTFQWTDEFQIFVEQLYQSEDGKVAVSLNKAPVGAMWYATWYEGYTSNIGPDGKALYVMTPGGPWLIDGRASNCTKRDDAVHKCWVRHGVPPEITVGKNGNTCSAGAGSIIMQGYHGFLRDGYLVKC